MTFPPNQGDAPALELIILMSLKCAHRAIIKPPARLGAVCRVLTIFHNGGGGAHARADLLYIRNFRRYGQSHSYGGQSSIHMQPAQREREREREREGGEGLGERERERERERRGRGRELLLHFAFMVHLHGIPWGVIRTFQSYKSAPATIPLAAAVFPEKWGNFLGKARETDRLARIGSPKFLCILDVNSVPMTVRR